MGKNKFILIIVALLSQTNVGLSAQDHRFMVFFPDKNSSYSIENPEEFLSARSIERRSKQQIAITQQDLPVNSTYVSSLESEGVSVLYATKWLNGALIQADSSIIGNIDGLSFISSVEYVAPGALKPQIRKNLYKKNQNNAGSRTQSTEIQNQLLGVDLMQQEGITGAGMLVAIFDGGFLGVDQEESFAHLTSNNQLVSTFDFVGNSPNVYRYGDHGTKVLSVITANNPGVFTGSAYDANIMLCVTEDVSSEYRIEEYNWLFAAEMADSTGADIINTSLGYSDFDDPNMNYTVEDLDGTSAVISNAATIAASKGMVITISAGNSGNSTWQKITAPADAFDILAVGAIQSDSTKSSFSSIGPTEDGRIKPDVVALGTNTALINRNGNIVFNNGTSFASPQIAGLAAGIWQANPDFDYLQVIEAIKNSGHLNIPNNQLGHGIPNYLRTKELVLSVDNPLDKGTLKLYPNPVGNQLFILSEYPIHDASFFIHNVSGQKVLENPLINVPPGTAIPVELPSLPPGVYLVTLVSVNESSTFRLIKK